MSGQDESNPHRDWLPEQARWTYLAHLTLPATSRKKHFPESHIINPLLTKLVRSRWLDIGLFIFLLVDLKSVLVHKHAKKELGQYPAILTSHLVSNPSIWTEHVDLKRKGHSILYLHTPSLLRLWIPNKVREEG